MVIHKKFISLFMVAVMTVLCFTSVACKKKPTQPETSFQIETPSDNNNSGEDTNKKPTTNLPTWATNQDFSDVLAKYKAENGK